MNLWTAIVVIVAIGCFTEVLKVRYRARGGITTDKQGNESATPVQSPALEREVQELRERVRVLERIATDTNTATALESRRVAQEIEALRDPQQS